MRTTMTVLAAAALLTLTGCTAAETEPDSASTTAEERVGTPTPTTSPAGEQTELIVNQVISDDIMGDTVTVTGLVRDFNAPSRINIPEGGGEWVLVKLDTAAGSIYAAGIYGGFTLVDAEGDLVGTSTSVIDEDVAAAGYPVWTSAKSGEQSTGWVAFQVNTRADVYQLSYKRLAATVIGSDETIPEKVWTVPLPTH